MDLPDEDILTRVQRGEREAYAELFDRYYARVERYALRQIRDAETARDLASETFLRAYRNVDKFRMGEISYLGYLLVICRRLILTEKERRRVTPTSPLEPYWQEVEQQPDTADIPLPHLLKEERKAMLHDALNRLPVGEREVIHLAFERGLSRRDIMTILEKSSVSAVTSHLFRALQRLRGLLVEQGYFSPLGYNKPDALSSQRCCSKRC